MARGSSQRRSRPLPLRERNKERARRSILAAARRLLDHHGYENATMRQIAEDAGVSHQTLYNYFPTKPLLLQALLQEDVSALVARVDAAIERYVEGPTGSLIDTVSAIHDLRFQATAGADRELWRVVSLDLLERESGTGDLVADIDRQAVHRLARLFEQARSRGQLAGGTDPATLAEIVFALGQHALARFLLDPRGDPAPHADALDRQTRLLLDAVAA